MLKIARHLRRSSLIVVVVLLVIGFSSFLHVSADGVSGASNCPLMLGMSAICKMHPLEHISAWQIMFAQMAERDIISVFLLALLAIFIARAWAKMRQEAQSVAIQRVQYSDRYTLPTQLQVALSRGILHTKAF